MALGRYLVEAVVLERRSVSELARRHGVSRFWIYKLLKRFHEGGFPALEPRSRRPRTCAHQTAASVQAEILQLRQELNEAGHDAGPQTIAYHLIGRAEPVPSVATIWRILKRHGLVTPQPQKRPRCSFIRFEAKLPNETWQCDATAWQLADGSPVEILNIEDDHSRLFANSSAFPTLKAGDVVAAFFAAADTYGLPASLLTDNAAVFSGGSRRGKVPLELELERVGIEVKHSTLITRKPAAKSNASIRHSSASWASNRPRTRLPSCSSNSTSSATTTTSDGPIVPWANRHRWPCSTPALRRDLICHWNPLTTECARTGSTPSAKSPCATSVDSATSPSALPTATERCIS